MSASAHTDLPPEPAALSNTRAVRMAVEAKRQQLRLPLDAFTLRAVAALERVSGGDLEKLDTLLNATVEAAQRSGEARIRTEHVDQAAKALALGSAERFAAKRRALLAQRSG